MLSTKDVKHIARLANLDLNDKEIEKFKPQLSKVLEYVGKLSEVNTSKIKATTHIINDTNRFQEGPNKSLSQKDVLRNANQSKNGYIQTEAVL